MPFVPLRLAALLVGAALGLAAVPAQAQTAPHPQQRAETHVESHRAAQRSGESRFDVIVVGATPARIDEVRNVRVEQVHPGSPYLVVEDVPGGQQTVRARY